jgi:hypothetical protein
VHRIPDAAAIVFMLGADTGVTRSDRELWSDHIAPIHGIEQSCYVVLNKIDGLRDGFKPEAQVLSEIDRQVKSSAETLRVDPTRVFALSAKQGLVAKIQNDRDGMLKSRLYRLEQALSRGMVHQRRLDHAATIRASSGFSSHAHRFVAKSGLPMSSSPAISSKPVTRTRNHLNTGWMAPPVVGPSRSIEPQVPIARSVSSTQDSVARGSGG